MSRTVTPAQSSAMSAAQVHCPSLLWTAVQMINAHEARHGQAVCSDAVVAVAACLPPAFLDGSQAVPDGDRDRIAQSAANLAVRHAVTDHSRVSARLASLDAIVEAGAEQYLPTGEGERTGRIAGMKVRGADARYDVTDADRIAAALLVAAGGNAADLARLTRAADDYLATIADREATDARGALPSLASASVARRGARSWESTGKRERDLNAAILDAADLPRLASLLRADPCDVSSPEARTLPVSRMSPAQVGTRVREDRAAQASHAPEWTGTPDAPATWSHGATPDARSMARTAQARAMREDRAARRALREAREARQAREDLRGRSLARRGPRQRHRARRLCRWRRGHPPDAPRASGRPRGRLAPSRRAVKTWRPWCPRPA